MNRADTLKLLVFVASLDNRQFGDETVLAWHAILGHLDATDARDAVVEHFGSSDAYLMPVHINRLATGYAKARNHQQRIHAQVIEAAPAVVVEERSPETTAALAELRDKLPAGKPDRLRFGTRFWRRDRTERGGPPAQAFSVDVLAGVAARILDGQDQPQ